MALGLTQFLTEMSTSNVVCFLLGNSPASEFYMPTFRNTLFHLHRQIGVEWLNLTFKKFGSPFYISLRKGDNHLQQNSFDLLSHGPPWHEPYLFHIPARGLYVGRYPFTTCCVTGPTPTPSPFLLLAQAIFEPDLVPKLFSNLVILHLPAYEAWTDRVFRNVGI
jgi:hypothetical protein